MIFKSEKVIKFLSDLEEEYSKIEMDYARAEKEVLTIIVTDINNKKYQITLTDGFAKTTINGGPNDYADAVVVANIKCITELERIREHVRITNAREFIEDKSEILFDRKINEIVEVAAKVYFNFYNDEEADAFNEPGDPDLIEEYKFNDTKNLLNIIYSTFSRELKEIQF